jgi:hypothetical protein
MVNLFQILNQLKIQASTSDGMSIIAIINAMRKILEISSRSDEIGMMNATFPKIFALDLFQKAIYDCLKNRFKTFYNNTFLCS